MNAKHFARGFRGIGRRSACPGRVGHGALVKTRDRHAPGLPRAMAGGKVTVVNLKHRGATGLIAAAPTDKRDKASIR